MQKQTQASSRSVSEFIRGPLPKRAFLVLPGGSQVLVDTKTHRRIGKVQPAQRQILQ